MGFRKHLGSRIIERNSLRFRVGSTVRTLGRRFTNDEEWAGSPTPSVAEL